MALRYESSQNLHLLALLISLIAMGCSGASTHEPTENISASTPASDSSRKEAHQLDEGSSTQPDSVNAVETPKKKCLLVQETIIITEVTKFSENDSTLQTDELVMLDAISRVMRENEDMKLTLIGHATESESTNLAQTRAEVVAAYMKEKDVDEARLHVSQQINQCPSREPSCCAQGQCVSYKITDLSGNPYSPDNCS